MSTPTVTLRSLKNEDTGIDISVLSFKKEEAPLGGVSILYEIFVLTRLDLFKTRLHKTGDVVHFTIFKAYREMEDLYNKLNKKYPKASLPPVPKSSTADKYTLDERVEALNIFMSALAKNTEICYSSTFTQFIGINSQRHPSFTIPTSSDATETINEEKTQKSSDKHQTENGDAPELFPKMKNVSNGRVQPPKDIDLFEEAKLSSSSTFTSTKSTTSKGLFDDFEDENLFSTKSVQKTSPPKEAVTKKPEKPPVKAQPTKKVEEVVDDSQIIIKDRKLGDLSLFKEQDLGDYVTKEEEDLFLVTPTSGESKKNTLLLSKENTADSEKNLNENLDDLLFLEPLPDPTKIEKKPEEQSSDSVTLDKVPPVPRPRRVSLEKSEVEQPLIQKPEVAPRKVFLNKPTAPPKPTLPAKPTQLTSTKPGLPTKPKPPPKKPKPIEEVAKTDTTALDSANANQSDVTDNSNVVTGLKDLDILKYIEQEEKSLDSNLSLFD